MPKKMGRPRKELDLEQLRDLASIQCTHSEIAAVLRCSAAHISHNQNYLQIIKEGQQAGKKSLRRSQFELAKKSSAMAIWLGKQYLGQREPDPEMKEFAKAAFQYYFEEQRKQHALRSKKDSNIPSISKTIKFPSTNENQEKTNDKSTDGN